MVFTLGLFVGTLSIEDLVMKKWKTLGSQYLFKRPPWLTIREDRLKMSNGDVMESYYVYEHPDWISVIAITKDGQMIMTEQYRHGLGEVCIELSAGVVDEADESHLVAAKRELLEETGYGGGKWELWTINSANITGIRKNMKNQLMGLYDKIMLRKRSIIETINDQLKNLCMIGHSRHRSFHNFLNNILTGIIAYSFLSKKPSIKFYEYQPDVSNQLVLF